MGLEGDVQDQRVIFIFKWNKDTDAEPASLVHDYE